MQVIGYKQYMHSFISAYNLLLLNFYLPVYRLYNTPVYANKKEQKLRFF